VEAGGPSREATTAPTFPWATTLPDYKGEMVSGFDVYLRK